MKIRAKSQIKLTNGRTNLDWTFVAGAELKTVAHALLVQIGLDEGKDAVIKLAEKVTASIASKGSNV